MSVVKLSNFTQDQRVQYLEEMCILAQQIKELTTKLQFRKTIVKEYMEEQGVDKIDTELGTIIYMSFDKDILNKEKTLNTIKRVNIGDMKSIDIENFVRPVGIAFPLIKINDIQREKIYESISKEV
jgi:hypothetical protein